MAENKKSFVLYADIISTFEELEDIEAGLLVKHLLRYVNDQNPEPPNRLIKLIFEPIKQQLKRDLNKWEGIKDKRSEAGKASAEARKLLKQQILTNSTHVKSVEQKEQVSTNSTVSVNDNVNVSVNVNDTVSVINKEKDKKKADDEALPPLPKKIKVVRTLEDFKAMAKLSFENNQCTFESNDFKKEWLKLLQEKKWKSKSQSAIDASLKILMKYDEVFAQSLVELAIAGEWQGVAFQTTDEHYKKFKNQTNGTNSNQSASSKKESRDRMANLARQILAAT